MTGRSYNTGPRFFRRHAVAITLVISPVAGVILSYALARAAWSWDSPKGTWATGSLLDGGVGLAILLLPAVSWFCLGSMTALGLVRQRRGANGSSHGNLRHFGRLAGFTALALILSSAGTVVYATRHYALAPTGITVRSAPWTPRQAYPWSFVKLIKADCRWEASAQPCVYLRYCGGNNVGGWRRGIVLTFQDGRLFPLQADSPSDRTAQIGNSDNGPSGPLVYRKILAALVGRSIKTDSSSVAQGCPSDYMHALP